MKNQRLVQLINIVNHQLTPTNCQLIINRKTYFKFQDIWKNLIFLAKRKQLPIVISYHEWVVYYQILVKVSDITSKTSVTLSTINMIMDGNHHQ